MRSKECFVCSTAKPLSEFYRHPEMADGHLNKCKDCTRKHVAENRSRRIDYYIAYDRSRGGDRTRRERAEFPPYTKRMSAYKRRAHRIYRSALSRGELVPQPCSVCGCEKVHGHHEDYRKPLDVIWLCQPHHRRLHADKKTARRFKGKRRRK